MTELAPPAAEPESSAAMRENRQRGERIIAYIRIALTLCAATGFVVSKLISHTFYGRTLEYLYLSALGLAVLYSLWLLFYLKRRSYRRFIPYLSSSVDVSIISLTIMVILAYATSPSMELIYFTLAYSVYYVAILLSLRRYDSINGLFTGTLASVQYLLIILVFRHSHELLVKYAAQPSSWMRNIAPSELFKGLLLFLAGILAFSLARNLVRRLLSTTRTEGALQVEQAYLTQFFESTPEAIVLSDNQTRILRINKAFTQMFGYSEEEAIGKPIDVLVAPENLRSEAGRLSHKAQEGEEFLTETLRCRKDRSLVEVSILGAPIYFQGRQTAIFGIYRDVTEQKRKERLFQALNKAAWVMQDALTHQRIIEAVTDTLEQLGYSWNVLLLDDGGKKLTVEYVSFESSLMKAVERLLGMNIREVRIPIDCSDDLLAVAANGETRIIADSTELVRAMLPGPLKRLAARVVKMLGVTRIIGAPLMQEGIIIGVLGVHYSALTEDDIPAIIAFANQVSAAWQKVSLIGKLGTNITELQQTQAQLIQAQKMEAVGRLAGGIAHDFNNLLTVIRGYSELLLNDFDLESSVHETVEEIRKAGEQASQLTGHLLAFSRKQVSRPQIVSINDTVRSMEKILQRLIGEDIDLQTRLETKLAPIRIDPHQIEQVIMNLAVNARDAMPEGGNLLIETANTSLSSDFTSKHPEVSEGAYVLLAISDTGSGIAESVLPQIFEPFFTTKERGRGTGLGLSTVYGIVKQSLGYIYAENNPDGGARFSVYFPPSHGEVASGGREEQTQLGLNGSEKILLVEDEESVRRLTHSILERSGYTVISAADGGQALNLDDRDLSDVRVLITDVVMPGLNGRVLAGKLRERNPALKVLFLSGYAADVTGVEISGSQEGELVQKPFSRSDLLSKLRQILDG